VDCSVLLLVVVLDHNSSKQLVHQLLLPVYLEVVNQIQACQDNKLNQVYS
jgi:hypothetical protein